MRDGGNHRARTDPREHFDRLRTANDDGLPVSARAGAGVLVRNRQGRPAST